MSEDDWQEPEDDPRYDRPTPRRAVLRQEARERSEVNHAAAASRCLRRASEVLTYRRFQPLDSLKEAARKHIAYAREARTLIGPPCPISRIPF